MRCALLNHRSVLPRVGGAIADTIALHSLRYPIPFYRMAPLTCSLTNSDTVSRCGNCIKIRSKGDQVTRFCVIERGLKIACGRHYDRPSDRPVERNLCP
jgi:hypothetical protein